MRSAKSTRGLGASIWPVEERTEPTEKPSPESQNRSVQKSSEDLSQDPEQPSAELKTPVYSATESFIATFIDDQVQRDYTLQAKIKEQLDQDKAERAKLLQLLKDGYVQFPEIDQTGRGMVYASKIKLSGLPHKAQEFLKALFELHCKGAVDFQFFEYYDQLACSVAQCGWLQNLKISSLTKDQYAQIFDDYLRILDHVPMKREIDEFYTRLGAPSTADFESAFGPKFKQWLAYYIAWRLKKGADYDELKREFHEEHKYPLDFIQKVFP